MWTEAEIRSALDGHFYRLDWARGETHDRLVPHDFIPSMQPHAENTVEVKTPSRDVLDEIAGMLHRGINTKYIAYKLGVSRHAVHAVKARMAQ